MCQLALGVKRVPVFRCGREPRSLWGMTRRMQINEIKIGIWMHLGVCWKIVESHPTKVESPAERECKPFLQGVVQMASYQHWIKKAQQTQIKCLFPASFGKRSPTLYWCPWGSVDQHPSKLLCGPTWTAGVAPGPHMGDWSPSEAVHELRPYGVSLVLLFRGAVMGLVWWWNPKQDDDNWSCGSSGRVPALQVWSPEFEL
jgi:hypothetical protein